MDDGIPIFLDRTPSCTCVLRLTSPFGLVLKSFYKFRGAATLFFVHSKRILHIPSPLSDEICNAVDAIVVFNAVSLRFLMPSVDAKVVHESGDGHPAFPFGFVLVLRNICSC
ncbi:hypothetical protein KP509_07G020500 [Ceratopteris richardii]|uniref:Uncharacterized protein n=1 Tax=Ceratopteris richardii TaxID=49495 RepID=A0A8T2UJ63_CERRI|nr:hypothetical protein KP509_07G020500 [Ceratopteris richardii]